MDSETSRLIPRAECSCIALNHDHEPRKCQRIGKIRGGVCGECQYWRHAHPVE